VRVKTGQASSKYLGTLIFLLLLFLNEVFPKAAFASTSLNACARSKECLELIRGSSSSAVSAPTGVGYGVTTLRTTTSSGVIKTFVNGVADFTIVVGPSAAYVSWHYWNEAHNGRAQDRAKQRYCAAYPTDVVCVPFTGGQSPRIHYAVSYTLVHPDSLKGNGTGYYYGPILGSSNVYTPAANGVYIALDFIISAYDVNGNRVARLQASDNYAHQYESKPYAFITSIARIDGQPDTGGNPPPLPWKDWSQEKRDRAVALLNDADWQRLTTSMPVGGTLDPGDSVKAPKIGIPGQEWDNPNTPLDDRRFKSIPGEYSRPIFPDFDHDSDPDETDADDDNDGFLDPYDTEPRNPYVPRASNDPPPPPEDDRTNQSDGERAVSEERQSQGDFLEKSGNEALQNRLDKIEDKYKKAAGMENEAATDPNVGFEQQRLIDEADSELQQLKDEISQAWWSSLSQAEQQLFDIENRSQADIDEIQMHMKQWDKGTYDDVAHSILDHSSRKGYDPLEFLRNVSNFDKSQAERIPEVGVGEKGTVRWEIRRTGEYIIETPDGQFVTYGFNPR